MNDSSARLRDARPFGALAPRRAYEAVAAELEVLVRAGHFAVGDRLPSERQLAARFGVSRPTVRVALSQLESRGLVVTRSGSGTFVAPHERAPAAEEPPTDESPAEVMEARITLEVVIARLAARRAPADREGLEDVRLAVEALERVANPEEVSVDIDVDFHRGVAALTGNGYLIRLVEPIWETMTQALLATLLRRSWSAQDTRRTAAEHRAIYEALRVGDGELAAFAMERHLRSLVAALFEDGAFEGPPPRFYA